MIFAMSSLSPCRALSLLGSLAACGAGLFLAPDCQPPQPTTTGPAAAESARHVAWSFELPERDAILASPVVAGDRIFVAAVYDAGPATGGVVYCLHRESRRIVWQFDDDGRMQQIYSTPCLAGGRLYVGEGMHGGSACKLYCLDAADGRKLWDFRTAGHIESSPCVADGTVFFGAGDDGLYALDAATSQKRWHYRTDLHLDSSPAVAGGRVFAGAGVSEKCKATAVICLDAADGRVVWRRSTDLPVWGSPAVAGDDVYFGLGNGRLTESAAPPKIPAGALLCADAVMGRTRWLHPVGDSAMARPAVDEGHVYFGARDGCCHCLDRKDGRPLWEAPLGSPVVTTPAVLGRRVYAVASGGQVACLDADGGRRFWDLDLARLSETSPRMLSSPRALAEDGGVRVYFGAELRNSVTSAAVLYCLRDALAGEATPAR
jgi:outer membrane protein assembly factor BamB